MYKKHQLKNAFGRVYLTIEAKHSHKWLYINWEGYLSDSIIKKGGLAITDAIESTGFNCILNDMTQVIGPIRNTEWAATEWAPQVAAAGLTNMALVTHATSMAVPDVSNFHSTQSHFFTEVFHDIDAAKMWLQQHCTPKSVVL